MIGSTAPHNVAAERQIPPRCSRCTPADKYSNAHKKRSQQAKAGQEGKQDELQARFCNNNSPAVGRRASTPVQKGPGAGRAGEAGSVLGAGSLAGAGRGDNGRQVQVTLALLAVCVLSVDIYASLILGSCSHQCNRIGKPQCLASRICQLAPTEICPIADQTNSSRISRTDQTTVDKLMPFTQLETKAIMQSPPMSPTSNCQDEQLHSLALQQ